MLDQFKVFIHMTVFIVGIVALSVLLGLVVLGQRWTSSTSTGPEGLYAATVKSYWAQDKRAISSEYSRSKAQWHIRCTNHGDKKSPCALISPSPR